MASPCLVANESISMNTSTLHPLFKHPISSLMVRFGKQVKTKYEYGDIQKLLFEYLKAASHSLHFFSDGSCQTALCLVCSAPQAMLTTRSVYSFIFIKRIQFFCLIEVVSAILPGGKSVALLPEVP